MINLKKDSDKIMPQINSISAREVHENAVRVAWKNGLIEHFPDLNAYIDLIKCGDHKGVMSKFY